MKKQYNTPEIELLRMPKVSVIMTSNPDKGDGDGGNVAGSRSRGQANWDDDDD